MKVEYVNIIVYARNDDYNTHNNVNYNFDNGDLIIYHVDGKYVRYNRSYWSKIEVHPQEEPLNKSQINPNQLEYPEPSFLQEKEVDKIYFSNPKRKPQ